MEVSRGPILIDIASKDHYPNNNDTPVTPRHNQNGNFESELISVGPNVGGANNN